MRIAPLAFLLDPSKEGDRTIIRDACRITHYNDEAYAGALAVVSAIRSVLAGDWSQQHSFLRAALIALPDSAVRDRIEELIRLEISPSEVASRFGANGHVVASVPLALQSAQFITEEPLPVVLARAISLGGDTDTVASISGQFAGTVGRPRACRTIFLIVLITAMKSFRLLGGSPNSLPIKENKVLLIGAFGQQIPGYFILFQPSEIPGGFLLPEACRRKISLCYTEA